VATNKQYDPDRHHRHGLRLPKHDYRFGTFFITVKIKLYEPMLEIPALRKIVQREWKNLTRRYPGAILGEFVIMPDHLHFLLTLRGLTEPRPYLWDVMRAFKSSVTDAWIACLRKREMHCPAVFWQTRYYERVVRDAREAETFARYIRENPEKLSDPKEMFWNDNAGYWVDLS
jgi:REP element-mobilizing transposase RayT